MDCLHDYLKGSMLLKLPYPTPIRMKDFWSRVPNVLSAKQFMHCRACGIHGIKYDKIAGTIVMAFESYNGNRMTRLLEIDWRQQSLADCGTIADCSLTKIPLDSGKQGLMSCHFALFVVIELLHCAIDF